MTMMKLHPEQLDNKRDLSVYSISVHGEDYALAPGLTLGEMRSKCGQDQVIVSNTLLQGWILLRSMAGPIQVNRGYSSWMHHRDVVYAGRPGDVTDLSYHLFGMAIDAVPLDTSVAALGEACKAVGFGGVKNYGSFVHFDVGRIRTW
jgi:hypothetical protein